MDENADLRLTIETARKNKNWARRCYAYELAMEYFSLLEPDCYELCSYCDSIPEFLEEKNECCLTRALGAVKVFVNRCVEAPTIARAVTRVIIEKIFFTASTKVREIATDIILDFIEWEACNAVLKELITGALKYDGIRSDECIRVMRYALLDFGPHVISIYKLIDFIAVLVRNKTFLSIDDECSQLLIVIYKCLGPQVRVHLAQILDQDYISAIEESYEEMRNIPIYHCRFVRYSKDNSSQLRESDEEVFAVCKIAESSHPSTCPANYGNEEFVPERNGMINADQSCFRDYGREPNYRDGPFALENKIFWDPQRLDNMANYEMDYGVGASNQRQSNQVRLNACRNELGYDLFDGSNRADSVPELFRHDSDVFLEAAQQDYQWNPNNFVQFYDEPSPNSTVDRSCQSDGFSTNKSTNPFEIIMKKLLDKYGTEDILDWLYLKLNSIPKITQNIERAKESMDIRLSRNCKSLELIPTSKKGKVNKLRYIVSYIAGEVWLPERVTMCYMNSSNENSFHSKSFINMNKGDTSIGNKMSPLAENNATKSLRVSKNKNENITAKSVTPFGGTIPSQEYLERNTVKETGENIIDEDNTESQPRTRKLRLVRWVLEKIRLYMPRKQKTPSTIPEEKKPVIKESRFVFKRLRSHGSYDVQNSHSINDEQTNYFHQGTENNVLQCERSKRYSRNNYTFNKSTTSPPRRTVFSDGWQTRLSRNQIPGEFLTTLEELKHDVRQSGNFPESNELGSEENVDEETVLSENESISEIFPNICCYCFQKNSIRRLNPKKSEGNKEVGQKSCERAEDKPVEEGIPGNSGSNVERTTVRTLTDSPFGLATEGNLFGVRSVRLRGSGDELSYLSVHGLEVPEEPSNEESQSQQKGQKLFCCISMNDTN